MRSTRKLATCCALLLLSGCKQKYTPPADAPMPPNTVLLSQMMRELSSRPGFTDAVIAQVQKSGKKGPAMLTPALVNELRNQILGDNWQGLDRFPGWTMHAINPTVRLAGHVAGQSDTIEDAASVHPGASPSTASLHQYLDVGTYALDKPEAFVDFNKPSTLPPFTTDGIISSLGEEVTRGDGPNPALAPEHPESQRLADTLNRLAANGLDGTAPANARVGDASALTPEALISALMASGHTVTVTDARYFANFGHFHYKGQEVMMPFWVNTEIVIPRTHGRQLLIPVSHAEYEWHVRGPQVNADVSYYFGIDGKSEWRTMDTLDQSWVLHRDAHTYTGPDALEVTRLAGLLTVAYMHLHAAHPTLPFGGYFAFGVCQDGVSAIEHKMTGKVTLFPNTADTTLFVDARDAEVNTLIHAIPSDREGGDPEPERVFGSLPTDPGSKSDFNAITIPGLGADLATVHEAWIGGTLYRTHSRLKYGLLIAAMFAFAIVGIAINRRRNLHDF